MTAGAWDKVAGKWKQLTGDVRAKWGDLTNDDFLQINGEREKLAGKIQERYGIAKDKANRQIDYWSRKLKF